MAPKSLVPTSTTLKRRLTNTPEELEYEGQPRKMPAIASDNALRPDQPFQDQTKYSNNIPAPKYGVAKPGILTVYKPPPLSTSRIKRATSAPPQSADRLLSGTLKRSTSRTGGLTKPGVDDRRLRALENQLFSIEEARAEANAKLSAELDTERVKAAEIQTNLQYHRGVLSHAKAQELNQRRDLENAGIEIETMKKKHLKEVADLGMALKKRDREIRELQEDITVQKADLEKERETVSMLKGTISHFKNTEITVTTQKTVLQGQVHTLQASLDESDAAVSQLRLSLEAEQQKVERLEAEAKDAEIIRRKLHNMVQELKGNIRVFCRVRPILPSDQLSSISDASHVGDQADISYPDKRDHREIVVCSSGETAMGHERKDTYNFAFDRVFEPESTQTDVFEEASQLVQSCTDGYNVCIFAYGQTGSGKSFTMEGGAAEAMSGMIPRAVQQVFRAAEDLKQKGWEYTMEGQFLEIYNETINDLLGQGEFDKKKHEIKHDPKTGTTRVTDINVVSLRSPSQVRSLLTLAQSRRSVAATLMNERSSRSHSIFTLRITGVNEASGERCEGSLNLVDLAGSERLNTSGTSVDRDRLKETKNINKSLSALGDVIAALGEKGDKGDKHIPYRNSKLTYLLQNSLGGNSKTLMVLNLSPLATHLGESLTSLRFATKVSNTTVGTAKRQTRTM